MKLKQINTHKRDENLFFDEKPHIYYIKGSCVGVTSVTTFIHQFFPKFETEKIIDKMMNSPRWYLSKYYGMKKEEIIQLWEDNKNLAAHKGTIMHKDIESYWNDKEFHNNTKEFNYFLNFVKDHKDLKPYRSEWEVYDEELLLAGSIDMIFEDDDGELIIYDWKRSKDIKETNPWEEGLYPLSHIPHANYWHYSLQLNIYKAILEKNYGKKVKEMNLLWLHPKNEKYVKLKVSDFSEEVGKMFDERKKEFE